MGNSDTDRAELCSTDPGSTGLEDIYRLAFESSPNAIAVSKGGRLLLVNPRFLDIFGYERTEEVLGLERYEWIHKDCRHEITQLDEEGETEGRGLSSHMLTGVRRDGSSVAIEVAVSKGGTGEGCLLLDIRDIGGRSRFEKTLQESEELLKDLADNSTAGFYLVQDGLFQYVNPAFARIHGYTVDEMVGKLGIAETVVPEEDGEQKSLARKRAREQGDRDPYEFRVRTKDGRTRLVQAYGTATTHRGRAAFIGTLLDVTEQRQAAQSLEQNEARLQALMDASPVAICWFDLEGNLLYINRQFQEFFGYTLEEIPTLDDWRLKAYPDAEYRNVVAPPGDAAATDGAKVPGNVWITCKNGSTRYVTRGRVVAANRAMVTYMDITKKEESERALRVSQSQLAEALELAKAAYWEFEPAMETYVFNDAFYALYGTTAKEQGGYRMSLGDYARRFIHPDALPAYFRQVEEARLRIEPEVFMEIEHRGLRRDGQEMHILSRVRALWNAQGQVTRVHGMNQDVTAHKKIEAELAQRAEELARSNAELEQFAYVASHDLQEPLRMVASYTELLSRRYKGKLDSDADEFIGFAVDGANRMKRLINDLLSYSRVGTKGKQLRPTSGESALEQALSNLALAIEDSRAVVTSDALPLVLADESQLVQLFQNLIANAVKFQASGTPVVHVSVESKGEEWIFAVRDNGIGIAPEYFDRIFLIFQRLHKKTDYAGTGVGLAVCQRIVQRHGGRIWVESTPGQGSTFYFTFPMKGERQL